MKKTFVIILTVLFLVGIAGLNAEEGEKRPCDVSGRVVWTYIAIPVGETPDIGIDADVELTYYWQDLPAVDMGTVETDGEGYFAFPPHNVPDNCEYAKLKATFYDPYLQMYRTKESEELLLPEIPGMPFVNYYIFRFPRLSVNPVSGP